MDALQLCNLALTRLGQAEISSLSETSHAAGLCRSYFLPTMDELLHATEWTFATARAKLTLNTTAANLTDFVYAYDLPADWVRTCVDENEKPKLYPGPARHEIEGTVLYCDIEEDADENHPKLVYIRSVAELSGEVPQIKAGVTLRPLFELAFALRLATVIGTKITKQPKLGGSLLQEYAALLAEAVGANARELQGRVRDADLWSD